MEKHQTEIVAKKSSRTIAKEDLSLDNILFRILLDLSTLFFLGSAITHLLLN